ncbi:MAG: double-strand break repair helicase AddA [Alphaproteobacteria bacterium]
MSAPAVSGARVKSDAQYVGGDPSQNVWVAASAGSGKTSVLVDRLLRLLLDGVEPHRLLCLTFTKAAAAEMSDRLFRELSRWVVQSDTELTATLRQTTGGAVDAAMLVFARRLFARVLETPGGLRIQTIHGFCESLLARFPLEAGQPPNFEVYDDRRALDLLASARDGVLLDASEDESLSRALSTVNGRVGESRFLEVVNRMVGERGRIDRLIAGRGGIAKLIDATFAALHVAPDESDETVVAAACTGGFNEPGLRAVAKLLLRGSKTDVRRGETLASWLSQDAGARAAAFSEYVAAFLKKKDGTIFERLLTKASRERMPDAEDILIREAERIVAVSERRRAVNVAFGTAALLELGDAILTRYQEAKRARNALDYDDLILRARALLTQSAITPWILFKLDGGIDHILVDEAQDTSPEQWEVVFALAEEFFAGAGARDALRTVFVVGDEKQSIYSFQGADPKAFEEMRHLFRDRAAGAQAGWQEVPLLTSYRSVPKVLEFVDRVFRDPAARAGVTFEDTWQPHTAFRQGFGGLVEVWPTITATEPEKVAWDAPVGQVLASSAEARLATRIARTIKAWIDRDEILVARNRPVRPEDIMILVRRRGLFFEEMVLALKKEGVPVAGADRMILTKQLVVEDLIALGRFVLLPEDDLTLAAVLKGPFCGFDDAQLFDLAAARGEARLWTTLQERHAENPNFLSAYEFLVGVMNLADFVTPYDFYAAVLGGGGRAKLLGRLGREAEDPMDEFMSRALAFERDHAPSLEGFLRWIEVDEAEVKRDLEQARNQVRVMTVHGAKGLQAPVVILPDTCTLPLEESPFFWTDDTDEALLLWPARKEADDALSRDARERTREARDREYRRLLYVAMTRAEDRLYVCGWETRNRRAKGCWYDLMAEAADELGADVEVDFGEDAGPQTVRRCVGIQVAPVAATPTQQDLPFARQPLPAWVDQAPSREPFPPRPLSPSRPSGDEQTVRSPIDDDPVRFRRGNVVHRLLQFLPEVAATERAAVAARFVAQSGTPFEPQVQEAIVAETLAVLAHPDFAEVFAPGSIAEAPVAGMIGENVVSGQVDRLAITDDEVLIVDFKTNRAPPTALEEVPAGYIRQMALYRAVLSRIYPNHAIRSALLWTDSARLMTIPEAYLTAVVP